MVTRMSSAANSFTTLAKARAVSEEIFPNGNPDKNPEETFLFLCKNVRFQPVVIMLTVFDSSGEKRLPTLAVRELKQHLCQPRLPDLSMLDIHPRSASSTLPDRHPEASI